MIGMINIPNDSPAEFYAARHYHEIYKEDPTSSKVAYDDDDAKSNKSSKSSRPTSFLNLFNRRKSRKQVTYLKDGRKIYDGQVDVSAAPKLWEELIVRSFVHKIEDEIQSPTDQLNTIQEVFPTLSNSSKLIYYHFPNDYSIYHYIFIDKSMSASTYSLVSQDRVKSQCDKCTPAKLITNLQNCSKLSKSSCRLQNVNMEHHHDHNDNKISRRDSLCPTDIVKKNSLSPSARILRRMSPRNSQ